MAQQPSIAVFPVVKFGDLDQRGEELEVTCQRCGVKRCFTGISNDRNGRALHNEKIIGRRFTCACGGIGLPTLKRRWVEALTSAGRARAARNARS